MLNSISCIGKLQDNNLAEQLLIILYVDQIQFGTDGIVFATDSGLYYGRTDIDDVFIESEPLSGIAIKSIATNAEHMYIATANGLYSSHDFAYSFSRVNEAGLSTADITDVDTDFDTGQVGVISGNSYYHSYDNGNTFYHTGNLAPQTTRSLSMQNGNIFICTTGASPNNLFYSTNAGTSFASIGAGVGSICNRIRYFESESNTVLIASTQGGIFVSLDRGASWPGSPYTTANGLINNNVQVVSH